MSIDAGVVAVVTVVVTNVVALARLLILTNRTRTDDATDREIRDAWRKEIADKLDTLTIGTPAPRPSSPLPPSRHRSSDDDRYRRKTPPDDEHPPERP